MNCKNIIILISIYILTLSCTNRQNSLNDENERWFCKEIEDVILDSQAEIYYDVLNITSTGNDTSRLAKNILGIWKVRLLYFEELGNEEIGKKEVFDNLYGRLKDKVRDGDKLEDYYCKLGMNKASTYPNSHRLKGLLLISEALRLNSIYITT